MRVGFLIITVLSGTAIVFCTGCGCSQCSISEENKNIVKTAFEYVAGGNFDAMDKVIAKDYVRHSQATPDLKINSLEDFKAFIRQDRAAIPDQKYEFAHLVADGDLVAFWIVYTGTHTGQMGPFSPTGKKVRLDVSGVHRLADGKIIETWVTWDNMAMIAQLGLSSPSPQEQPEPSEPNP